MGYSQDYDAKINELNQQLETAISNEDFEKASQLKKERDLYVELKDAIQHENFERASEIKKELTTPETIKSEKAVIYLFRVTEYAKHFDLEYYHHDKFIHQSDGTGYFKYELEPGSHLLWVCGASPSFMTVEVEAGKSYFAIIDIQFFGMKAKPFGILDRIEKNESELIERCISLLKTRTSDSQSKSFLESKQIELDNRGFIANKLKLYDEKRNTGWAHIGPEDFFDLESLLKNY